MEEDIKILEEYLKGYYNSDLLGSYGLPDKETQALEKLIKGYREIEEMLKNRIKYTNELEKDLFENASKYVVPKSKIKEKIEELKKYQNTDGTDDYYWKFDEQIELLQELMEDE